MNFLRNPEIKRDAILWGVLGLALTLTGLSLGVKTALLVLACVLSLGVVHFTLTYLRYRKLSSLALDIDALLHQDAPINFSSYGEGELALLQSELSKMTLRLREQTEALSHDKLALTDSIADISHQLRTPLTSINIMLSILSNPDTSPEKRASLVKDLERLIDRIDWLVSSLLKMSKLDADTVVMKRTPVTLADLVRHSSEPLLIPMELRNQTLSVNLQEGSSFTGDLSWTTEALSNILKNCMEHTPMDGTVTVTGSENSLYTEIIVSDTGPGIDSRDLPHLFERFYKGKNSAEQSVGIGLALARVIITKQNGTIKAENDPAGGARFVIRLYKGVI